MSFKHVFAPVQLRHKQLKNRIVFGAHTTNMAHDGLPGDQHLAYYLERALGGAAMIVVEPMPVHAAAVLTRGNFRHSSDDVIPHFARITQACKAHGTVMIQQLYQWARMATGTIPGMPTGRPRAGPAIMTTMAATP